MLPLPDGIPARRFPIVNVLIVLHGVARGILSSPQPAKPAPVAEMRIGAGSGIVSLVIDYQQ